MTHATRITVAPNGARRQKADHTALPMSPQELTNTARDCFEAGADAIHLHVRDSCGAHSLDTKLYETAIAAVTRAVPSMGIQVTTEAAGRYDVADQLRLLQDLRPAAASISVREIARSRDLAPRVYETARAYGTQVQHILYGNDCVHQLGQWFDAGIVPRQMGDAILVLGQYAPPRAGNPDELGALLDEARLLDLQLSVCAFGADEQACLIEAAKRGCDVRVGFENNTRAPDGKVWSDNAQAVASLRRALDCQPERRAG